MSQGSCQKGLEITSSGGLRVYLQPGGEPDDQNHQAKHHAAHHHLFARRLVLSKRSICQKETQESPAQRQIAPVNLPHAAAPQAPDEGLHDLAMERLRLCRVQAAFSYTSPPDWTAPLSGRGSYAAPSLCHDDSRLVGFSFFFVANFNRKMQKLPLFRAFQ